MPKKQHIVVIILFFAINLFPATLKSQDYKGSIGGRFGYGIGLTGMYYIQNGHGLEFLLRYGYHGLILNKPGFNFQVLYEKHWSLGRGNWTVFAGAGPDIGFGKRSYQSKLLFFVLGVGPIVGFDYTTQRLRLPMVFALDYKPTFNADFLVNGAGRVGTDFSYYEFALSVRFCLGRSRR